ncbi:HlyD family secretion protein [Mitsuaria sp. GD03876]|uniref:HlyD family secretion protein n=1 Tax=Mitsuaria sp. GD03876 TaxID=2975399 RepID=UPI00244C1CC8|nr:HlyD family secretion protein [Mitsuaria sp. GD03876]MDH0864713.1 HlyD family secretion protein [Mitsuaria sp. GD03876]
MTASTPSAAAPSPTSSAAAPTATAPSTAPRRSLGRATLPWAVLTAAALAVAAYGAHWWSVGRFHEETDDAYVGGDVTVIGAKVGGYITELPVADNQFVHAGDLLARIDGRDYQAAVQRATGAVEAQEAAIANLAAAAALQQAVIAKARAGIDAASAEEQRARDDFARYKDLVGRAAVSVESSQRAEAAFKTAQAGSARARAEQLAAERQLDVIATQKRQAQAALAQAGAERELAHLNLGYTELRAPRDGYVGNRKARVGTYVGIGTPLLSVVPAHGLWIDANFKEDQLARMQAGQPVSIRADAWPGVVMHGTLGSLAPATGAQFSVLPAENATGNFTKIVQRVPVRIQLDTADERLGRLRPGLSVVVEVDTARDAVAATKTASVQ